jgi:hypothetical protein
MRVTMVQDSEVDMVQRGRARCGACFWVMMDLEYAVAIAYPVGNGRGSEEERRRRNRCAMGDNCVDDNEA